MLRFGRLCSKQRSGQTLEVPPFVPPERGGVVWRSTGMVKQCSPRVKNRFIDDEFQSASGYVSRPYKDVGNGISSIAAAMSKTLAAHRSRLDHEYGAQLIEEWELGRSAMLPARTHRAHPDGDTPGLAAARGLARLPETAERLCGISVDAARRRVSASGQDIPDVDARIARRQPDRRASLSRPRTARARWEGGHFRHLQSGDEHGNPQDQGEPDPSMKPSRARLITLSDVNGFFNTTDGNQLSEVRSPSRPRRRTTSSPRPVTTPNRSLRAR